jgi:general secretion pathway protein K
MRIQLRIRTAAARRGFALLAVLWVLVAVAALGLAASLAARDVLAVARNRMDLTSAEWLAEGCLERARALIDATLDAQVSNSNAPTGGWPVLDRVIATSPGIDTAACDVSAEPATTTVNVNEASAEQLHKLFEALGILSDQADSLTDAVLDWLDGDDLERAFGAERTWYQRQGRPLPRNGPLGHASEVRWIRGLSDIPALERVLGVEPGRIHLRQAPAAVLASLPGFGEETVLRITEARRMGGHIPNLAELVEILSPSAKEALLARYAELERATTAEPDAWVLMSRAHIGSPPVTAVLEVRLERAGTRAAIVRRRTWIE